MQGYDSGATSYPGELVAVCGKTTQRRTNQYCESHGRLSVAGVDSGSTVTVGLTVASNTQASVHEDVAFIENLREDYSDLPHNEHVMLFSPQARGERQRRWRGWPHWTARMALPQLARVTRHRGKAQREERNGGQIRK